MTLIENKLTTITLTQAREVIAAAVAEKGEDYTYVYPADPAGDGQLEECTYADPFTKEASCLVGNGLHRIGLTIDQLLLLDNSGTDPVGVTSEMFRVRLAELGYQLSDEALRFFTSAQNAQDLGKTWGTAQADALANADTTED